MRWGALDDGGASAVALPGASEPDDCNAGNMELVKAVLCGGLFPNVAVAPRGLLPGGAGKEGAGKKASECALVASHGQVFLHPSCINAEATLLDSRYSVGVFFFRVANQILCLSLERRWKRCVDE